MLGCFVFMGIYFHWYDRMEVIASNAGLLTNAEVLEIIKENRSKRSTLGGVKVELQGRELVETKVSNNVSPQFLRIMFISVLSIHRLLSTSLAKR